MKHVGSSSESFTSPEHEIEVASKRDYRLGFIFGQNSISTQRLHYRLLRPHYIRNWEQSDLARIADKYQDDHRPMIPKMPHGHEKYLSLQLASPVPQEFANRWIDFSDYALRGKAEVEINKNMRFAHMLVAKSMIIHDTRKIADGRAAENVFHDPYASFFRNYILLGESTNSPTFDTSLAGLRSYVQTSELMAGQEVADLQAAWLARHPGEQFFA